eukprot:scaffold4.g4829.t1
MGGRRGATAALVAAVAWLAWLELSRPTLLLVGNVTIDVVNGQRSAGGAVTYAAAAAAGFGITGRRACVVTAAAPDADLSSLRATGLDIVVVPSPATLTFEHSYTFWGSHRKLRVPAQPGVTLSPAHVPARCRGARVLLLGPLMPDDMDSAAFVADARSSWRGWLGCLALGRPQLVGLMAQGLQRDLDYGQRVVAVRAPSEQLLASLGPGTSVFLSDVETDAWRNGTAPALAARAARLLVTRGSAGADELTPTSAARHLPFPVDQVVDTNGAGDTFATAYMLALAAGHSSPAAVANWAGGLAVTQPQSCKPACVGDAIRAAMGSMPPSRRTHPLQGLARTLGLVAPSTASSL